MGAAVLALAACSSDPQPDAGQTQAGVETPASEDDAATTIECALGGGALKKQCEVEQVRVGDKLMLVVRHPDGGFRRFEVLKDGHGLAVADGAEQVVSEVGDGSLDVTVGKDRYIFPAKVKSPGHAAQ